MLVDEGGGVVDFVVDDDVAVFFFQLSERDSELEPFPPDGGLRGEDLQILDTGAAVSGCSRAPAGHSGKVGLRGFFLLFWSYALRRRSR